VSSISKHWIFSDVAELQVVMLASKVHECSTKS
jgi:hypothetical protein